MSSGHGIVRRWAILMNKWLDSTIKNYMHYFSAQKKPVVWEVGSRDGHDGVELARRIYYGEDEWFWANATIVCFEPNPEQARIIEKNYPEVSVYEMAASDQGRFADFMVYEGDEGAVGSSSLNLDWKEKDLDGTVIRVEAARLDTIISDEVIDIMKIDVEGHSLQVLEGLGEKLKQIKVIHVETETWTGSDRLTEHFMKNHGWQLVDVQEQWGGMPDQVWINPEFLGDSAE